MSKYENFFVNESAVPNLYEQKDSNGKNMTLYSAIYTPFLKNWSWWILEKDPNSGLCFGYVDGDFGEFGYFDLDEMTEGGIEFKVHPKFKPGMTVSEAHIVFEEDSTKA